jgi:hypothetical protein
MLGRTAFKVASKDGYRGLSVLVIGISVGCCKTRRSVCIRG